MKKRFLSAWLAAMVIGVSALTVSADSQASFQISGDSQLAPGAAASFQVAVKDVATVTGGLEGIQFDVQYDSNVLELKKSVSLLSDSWQLRSSAVSAGVQRIMLLDGDLIDPVIEDKAFLRLEFTVKATATVGQTGKITLTEPVGSSGAPDYDSVPVSAGEHSYTIQKPISTNNYLSSIKLNTGTLKPSFNKNTLSYQCSVPYSTDKITVSAVAEDKTATVSVSDTALKAGATTQVIVTVVAENGQKRNYTINVTRAAAPAVVKPSSAPAAVSSEAVSSETEPVSSEEAVSSEEMIEEVSSTISSETEAPAVSSEITTGQGDDEGGFPIVGIVIIVIVAIVIAAMVIFIILDQKKKKANQ